MEIILGTRKSMLAQAQTDRVGELLNNLGYDYKKLLIVTEGDRRLDVTLNKIGGKGLFIKEIEQALLECRAHGAVHSLKDMPYETPKGFSIVSIPEREDVRDAFISRENIDFRSLKSGAKIGTSSIRRAEQLRLIRNDIEIVPIRGNVQTRLKKMEEQKLDGIVLASAGLKRLGEEKLITNYFSPEEIIPAVGQGALAIETIFDSAYKEIFKKLNNEEIYRQILGERSFMRSLNGGCHSLIGAYSKVSSEDYYLLGIFQVGDRIIKQDIVGSIYESEILGKTLGEKILNKARE